MAPQWTAASIDIVPSIIAWASGSLELVKLPEQRRGRFSRRASWPITMDPMAGSGVPKVGEPERSDIDDRKLPKTTGAPGRSSWVRAQPASVSASDCAMAPALVTGPMAPPRMKGTRTVPCPARAYSRIPLVMVPSQTRGELTLKLPMMTQWLSAKSRPNSSRVISMLSAARVSCVTEPRKARSE